MTLPILYSFRRCPYAMRARMALILASKECELREILLKDKPDKMLQVSSKGTVPVLEFPDKVIDESLDIMLWALNINDSEDILCPYREQKNFVLDSIKIFDLEFKYHLDRFKYSARFNASEEDYHFLEATKFIKKWNKILTNNSWIIGDKPSIADWCIWPFVRQFKIACESHKKTNYFDDPIKDWLGYFEKHQHFKKLMHKYDPWKPSKKKEYFHFN